MAHAFQLEKYATGVADYRAQVEKVLGAHQANLERVVQIYRAEADADVAMYRALTDNALGAFQATLETYRGTVESAIKQAEITARERAQDAEMATTVSVANKAKSLEEEAQQQTLVLRRYEAQLSAYQMEVAGLRAVFDGKLEKFKTNIISLRNEIKDLRQEYGERLGAYVMNPMHGAALARNYQLSTV
jgi:hypothetical protein